MSTLDSHVSTSEPEPEENTLEILVFSDGLDSNSVKNVYIFVNIPGIFPTEKPSTKFNCREHYKKMKFNRVYITYTHDKGLHIIAYPKKESNEMQELFVPERYIVCVGVDHESK